MWRNECSISQKKTESSQTHTKKKLAQPHFTRDDLIGWQCAGTIYFGFPNAEKIERIAFGEKIRERKNPEQNRTGKTVSFPRRVFTFPAHNTRKILCRLHCRRISSLWPVLCGADERNPRTTTQTLVFSSCLSAPDLNELKTKNIIKRKKCFCNSKICSVFIELRSATVILSDLKE